MRPRLLGAIALGSLASIALIAQPALAEIFECVGADGSVTFINDRSDCPDARPHPLKERIERAASPTTRAGDAPPDPSGASSPEQRLERALLTAADVGPGWDIVNETPVDSAQDPDLVEWGVLAQRSRHYTRTFDGASQVCSVELWAFEDAPRAQAADENFEFPNWQIDREGELLVMVRALTLRGNDPPQRAIYPDCDRLGKRVRARVAERVGD